MIAQKRELLGTIIEIQLEADYFDLCWNELQRIETAFSRFLDSSELSRINQNLNEWQSVSDELLQLIKVSLVLNEQSAGSFDITVKETLDNLGYDKEYSFQDSGKVAKKTEQPIELNGNKIFLKKQIDLGGLGKGYAMDQVAQILKSNNVDRYYINAGGDILAQKGAGEDFTIILEHPDNPKNAIGTVILDNRAVATSAADKRVWKDAHHLIDPLTQRPAREIKRVYVVADSAQNADAWATALFVSTLEDAMELAIKNDVEAIVVSSENKVFTADNFSGKIFT